MTYKIFINPGHSKNASPDSGCAYNGIKEAIICAQIGEVLSSKLKAQGFETVVYQQQGDNLTSNQQLNLVPKQANASKADIFISIHMNGFSSSSAKGTETWYYNGSTKGQKLAELCNTQLTKAFDDYTLSNRGAKVDQRGLLVLRSTNMPSVLTEIGFISNADEAKFIQNNIDAIAQRLCNAVCEYFGVEVKTVSSQKAQLDIQIKSDENDLYNCSVGGVLKLKGNKLTSILEWIEKNYA